MQNAMELIENEIGALRFDLKNANSIAEEEAIEEKIEMLQAEYRMILNAMDL